MKSSVPLKPVLLVLAESGDAPEWIQVFPEGAVQSSKGDFVADAEAQWLEEDEQRRMSLAVRDGLLTVLAKVFRRR